MKSFDKKSVATVLCIMAPSIIIRPLSMDTLLPAIPTLAQDFQVPFSTEQWFLSIFFIGAGLGQLVVGPLADEYGRRRVLLCSTWLILITSFICTQITHTRLFLLARLVQGIGACGTTVASMAMMRDLYGEHKLAKVYSYFNTIIGISPLIGPMLGGVLLTQTGTWRGAFYFVIFFSICALVIDYLFVAETNPKITARHEFERVPILKGYKHIFSDKELLGYCLCTIMAMGIVFMFYSMSSILLIQRLGIHPDTFSTYYSATMVLYLLGTLVSPIVQNKMGLHATVVIGTLLMLIAGIILFQLDRFFGLRVWAIVAPNMLSTFGAAILFGPCMAGVMANYKHMAGIASAVYGALFLVGCALLVGAIMQLEIYDGKIMAVAMICMSLVCLFTISRIQIAHKKKLHVGH